MAHDSFLTPPLIGNGTSTASTMTPYQIRLRRQHLLERLQRLQADHDAASLSDALGGATAAAALLPEQVRKEVQRGGR